MSVRPLYGRCLIAQELLWSNTLPHSPYRTNGSRHLKPFDGYVRYLKTHYTGFRVHIFLHLICRVYNQSDIICVKKKNTPLRWILYLPDTLTLKTNLRPIELVFIRYCIEINEALRRSLRRLQIGTINHLSPEPKIVSRLCERLWEPSDYSADLCASGRRCIYCFTYIYTPVSKSVIFSDEYMCV